MFFTSFMKHLLNIKQMGGTSMSFLGLLPWPKMHPWYYLYLELF